KRGAESETAKTLSAKMCAAYVTRGAPPERSAEKTKDMAARREKFGLGPMIYGVAAYSIVRNTEAEAKAELTRITDVKQSAAGYNNYQQWLAGTQLEQRVSLEDYSVSNRGLRSGLVGTPQQVLDRVKAFEAAGVNLLLLPCTPRWEEMNPSAEGVIKPSR